MKIAISLLGLLSLVTVYGQSPLKLWEVYHDGSLTGKDMANALVIDPSGNIYVTGRCYQSANGGNFTTVKYDANGNLQWVDHYNGTSANGANRGINMVMDQWNNVYVIGTVSSNQGDIAIVKYNPSGMVWSKSYEPYWFGSAGDFGVGIAVDTLGHIYAAGQITSLSGTQPVCHVQPVGLYQVQRSQHAVQSRKDTQMTLRVGNFLFVHASCI